MKEREKSIEIGLLRAEIGILEISGMMSLDFVR